MKIEINGSLGSNGDIYLEDDKSEYSIFGGDEYYGIYLAKVEGYNMEPVKCDHERKIKITIDIEE